MTFPTQDKIAEQFGRIEIGAMGRPTERWESRALIRMNLPYRMRLAWSPETVIRRITCHRAVLQSLSTCLHKILEHYQTEEAIQAAGMDLLGVTYAFGLTPDGTCLSPHAYGAAIDLNPAANPLGEKHAVGAKMMPQEVVSIFKGEGWAWGGRNKRLPECGHFQATS